MVVELAPSPPGIDRETVPKDLSQSLVGQSIRSGVHVAKFAKVIDVLHMKLDSAVDLMHAGKPRS
jgi:hypothetical protein